MFLRYIGNITIFIMNFAITFWILTVFIGAIEVIHPIRWDWLTYLMGKASIPVTTQSVVICLSFIATALPALFSQSVLMKKFILWDEKATLPEPEQTERLTRIVNNIKEKAGITKKDFRLYIGHIEGSVNAYAITKNEILVTKDLYDTFNDQQLTGILAHEIGHIMHDDVQNTKLNWAIDVTSSIVLTVIYGIKCLVDMVCAIPIIGWPFYLISWILSAIIFICNWILNLPAVIINRYSSRENEKNADLFACEIGLSDEIYEGIKELTKDENTVRHEERLYTTHPERKARLKNIEKYIEEHKAITNPAISQQNEKTY